MVRDDMHLCLAHHNLAEISLLGNDPLSRSGMPRGGATGPNRPESVSDCSG